MWWLCSTFNADVNRFTLHSSCRWADICTCHMHTGFSSSSLAQTDVRWPPADGLPRVTRPQHYQSANAKKTIILSPLKSGLNILATWHSAKQTDAISGHLDWARTICVAFLGLHPVFFICKMSGSGIISQCAIFLWQTLGVSQIIYFCTK